MAFPFPTNPVDGQVVTHPQPDGSVLTATYHASKNEWVVTRSTATQTPVTSSTPITVTPTADRQVITWDARLGTWIAAKPELKLTELQDVVHNISPSLGESPLWQYAVHGEAQAQWQWGTANAHVKTWDSTRHWESGATVFHKGHLWRGIHNNTNVEPKLEDGKVTLFIHAAGEPTFGIVPMGLGAAAPPSGDIDTDASHSKYGYYLQYTDDTHMTLWKFIVKGLSPVTNRPIGVWEGRPWHCLAWRKKSSPPPNFPGGIVMVWIYSDPGSTTAPVLGQQTWAVMDVVSSLMSCTDVDAANPSNDDLLRYDGTLHKWVPIHLVDLRNKLAAIP